MLSPFWDTVLLAGVSMIGTLIGIALVAWLLTALCGGK